MTRCGAVCSPVCGWWWVRLWLSGWWWWGVVVSESALRGFQVHGPVCCGRRSEDRPRGVALPSSVLHRPAPGSVHPGTARPPPRWWIRWLILPPLPFTSPFSLYLSLRVCLCQSVCLSFSVSVCLSHSLSLYLSLCLSLYLSLSVCLSVCLSLWYIRFTTIICVDGCVLLLLLLCFNKDRL